MIRTLFHIALMTASVVVLIVSAVIATILIVIAWPLWYIRRRRAREQSPQIALEVLNRRYALGEIDRTEYLQTRDDILVERRITKLREGPEV
jgi:uncharacterized membrane protein